MRSYAKNINEVLTKIIMKIARLGMSLSMFAVLIMVIFIFIDVTMRVAGRPVLGFFQVVELLMVSIVFFAMPLTQAEKGNADISILFDLFPKGIQRIVSISTYFIGMVYFLLLALRSIVRMQYLYVRGETTGTINLPIYPFYFLIFLGCLVLCLVLYIDINNVIKGFGKKIIKKKT